MEEPETAVADGGWGGEEAGVEGGRVVGKMEGGG